jgi:hypothetical protein
LLRVLEVSADLVEGFREIPELLLKAGETICDSAGIFFDLHSPKSHSNNAQMGVQRVG